MKKIQPRIQITVPKRSFLKLNDIVFDKIKEEDEMTTERN